MRHLLLGRLLAAAALAAAAAGGGIPAPASAAGCSSVDGVTVVVDFNELGGGVPSLCDADGGGKKASTLFGDAGFPLTYASRMPGFVCRVSGVPASDPCVNTAPTNAYWGLWWSDGKTGSWSYSSLGAGSLNIPEGGYVAFSWDQSDSAAPPSFTPAAHRTVSTPTPTPTHSPSSEPTPTQKPPPASTQGPSSTPPNESSAASPSVAPTTTSVPPSPGSTSASPSASASSGSASPGAATSDVPTDPAAPDQDAAPAVAEPDADGLPSFVAPALIATLFGVAGVVYLVRRRPGSP